MAKTNIGDPYLTRAERRIWPLAQDVTRTYWVQFANFTNPVLARCCSRVLLELQALSCAGMTLFAVLWPAFGQQNSRIRVSFLLSHVDSRTYSFAHGISH